MGGIPPSAPGKASLQEDLPHRPCLCRCRAAARGAPSPSPARPRPGRSRLAEELLTETIRRFRPDVVAFSWRDVQVFSPQDMDGAMRDAFTFFYDPSPLTKSDGRPSPGSSISSLTAARFRTISLLSDEACKTAPSALVAVGGPSHQDIRGPPCAATFPDRSG